MALNNIQAFYYYTRAQKLRKEGNYNGIALKYFLKAWHLSENKSYLIAYIKHRRDLGRPITISLAQKIVGFWQELSSKEKNLMAAFFLESSYQSLVPSMQINSTQKQIPAALAFSNLTALSSYQQILLSIYSEQQYWRASLTNVLRLHVRTQGICIVGNSGIMRDSSLGSAIDATGFVVRFNAFKEGYQASKDLGSKYDAWCVTPSFRPSTVRAHTVSWLIVTGPAVEYRLADWSALFEFRAKNLSIVTLPLNIWRELVRELQAPPSAGVSLLAFFYSLFGSWSGIKVAGFGALTKNSATYHYMNSKNKASKRHNWLGEKYLIERWLREGLTSLHD